MRNTLLIAILVAGLGALGAFLYAQPGKAFNTVKLAMDRGDAALLASVLDAPSMRSNMKNREAAKLSPTIPQDGPAALLGMLGQALAEGVIGVLAQGAATPEGVLALLRSMAAAAQDPPQPTPSLAPRTPSERLFANAKTELSGFDRYAVSAPLKDGHTLVLVFARQGSAWLLSDVAFVKQADASGK